MRTFLFLFICFLSLSLFGQAQVLPADNSDVLECSKKVLFGTPPTRTFPILGGSAPFAQKHHKTRAGWFVKGGQIETIINNEWLTLLPNKKLIVGKNNVEERLDCNLSSMEVIRIIETNSKVKSATQTQTASSSSDTKFPHLSDIGLCNAATDYNGKWMTNKIYEDYVKAAKQRGLSCGVKETGTTYSNGNRFRMFSDEELLNWACFKGGWSVRDYAMPGVQEAKRRGLSCRLSETSTTQTASSSSVSPSSSNDLVDFYLGTTKSPNNYHESAKINPETPLPGVIWANRSADADELSDKKLCEFATDEHGNWDRSNAFRKYFLLAQKRQLTCGVEVPQVLKPLLLS